MRAHDLLDILYGIRGPWQESMDLLATQVREPSRHAAATRPPAELAGFGYGEWVATQTQPKQQAPPRSPDEKAADGRGTGAADPSTSATAVLPKSLLPSDPEVPNMDVGYGLEGASVQREDLGTIYLTDRDIMKKTLLRGEAWAFSGDACDAIGIRAAAAAGGGGKRKKVALQRLHWGLVMKAGLSQYCVGTFVPASESKSVKRQSYVQFDLPMAGDPLTSRQYQPAHAALPSRIEHGDGPGRRAGRKARGQPAAEAQADEAATLVAAAATLSASGGARQQPQQRQSQLQPHRRLPRPLRPPMLWPCRQLRRQLPRAHRQPQQRQPQLQPHRRPPRPLRPPILWLHQQPRR